MTGPIIGYRLEPVHESQPGSIQTAAVMTCMATGKELSGMGGGGDFISPEVFASLRGGPLIAPEVVDELLDLRRIFDLQWEADRRAIERWHAAGGDSLTWPDRADMVVWLLGELNAAERCLAQVKEMVQQPGPCDEADDPVALIEEYQARVSAKETGDV